MSQLGDASLYACLALSLLAAVLDVRSRRIPNIVNALVALTAITFAYATGGWEGLGLNALHALAALVIGMGLFAAGVIGAGDAKMYSAVAFAISLADALPMLGWTSLSGFALLLLMTVIRLAMKQPLKKDGVSFTVPYGVAIASGFWLTALA